MGNPTIYWDRGNQSIDLGSVENAIPGRRFEGSRYWSGTTQVALERMYDVLELSKVWTEAQAPGLYAKLNAFWDSVARGEPFSFALDSAKAYSEVPVLYDAFGNYLANGDLAVWPTGGTPTNWTIPAVGGTSIVRETDLVKVWDGLYSLRFARSATDQAIAKLLSVRTIYQPVTLQLTFRYRNDAATPVSVNWYLKDVTGGTYWSSGSTWGAGPIWQNPGNPSNAAWTQVTSAAIGGLANSTRVEVGFRNPTTGDTWVDDVRLWPSNHTLVVTWGSFLANDWLRLRSRSTGQEEWTKVVSKVDNAGGSQTLTVSPYPVLRLQPGDLVRHADWWPRLGADQADSAVEEIPGNLQAYSLKLKAREVETGRA